MKKSCDVNKGLILEIVSLQRKYDVLLIVQKFMSGTPIVISSARLKYFIHILKSFLLVITINK